MVGGCHCADRFVHGPKDRDEVSQRCALACCQLLRLRMDDTQPSAYRDQAQIEREDATEAVVTRRERDVSEVDDDRFVAFPKQTFQDSLELKHIPGLSKSFGRDNHEPAEMREVDPWHWLTAFLARTDTGHENSSIFEFICQEEKT